MLRTARPLLSGLVLTLAAPLAAQLPSITPEQAAAGHRVASVRFEPGRLELHRGDSVTIQLTMLDEAGQAVSGATGFLFSSDASVAGPQASAIDGENPGRLSGNKPGIAQALVLIRVPDGDASFRGFAGLKEVGRIDVAVKEWPVASIQIDPPPFRAYAGTVYRLRAHAMTTHSTVSLVDQVTWKSETPTIAGVTPDGIVSPSRPGRAVLVASTENGISTRHVLRVLPNPIAQLSVSPAMTRTRTGDVVRLQAKALDARGRPVDSLALAYSVSGLDSAGAVVYGDGAFVAENAGAYRVVVSGAGKSAEAVVEAVRRPEATEVQKIGRGARSKVTTSDLWVFTGKDGRDYAYTGTHAQGGGQRMFAWDVTDPANVVLTDSVVVDARVVNDVKVNNDASWAIITREGASTRKNGIVVLDLSSPAHPKVLAELTDSLTGGIHNTWINGDVVYAINDGTSAMNIIDLSDPAHPKNIGRWELRPGDTDKYLHDVWSDGKYAYLSYWNDGLVILDVGAGTHGGTPTAPKFVSSVNYGQGNTHTAYREGNYVFVGDEIFGCKECINGPRGYIHVMDVKDINHPHEVARFEVPEAGTHNIWVENQRLYIAYYQGGLRVVDVSGELRGDLYRQGRQIGWYETAAPEGEAITPNAAMAWGPQLFKGDIYVSDMNSGLWVLKQAEPASATP